MSADKNLNSSELEHFIEQVKFVGSYCLRQLVINNSAVVPWEAQSDLQIFHFLQHSGPWRKSESYLQVVQKSYHCHLLPSMLLKATV